MHDSDVIRFARIGLREDSSWVRVHDTNGNTYYYYYIPYLLYYPGSIDIITYLRGQRSIWFNWHQPRLLKACYSKRSSDPLIKHFVCTRFQRSSQKKKKKTWANAERPVVTVVRLYNLKKAARLKILRYTLHNINL